MKNGPTAVAELGNIVTVWAHPDDESYLAGGLMAMARQAGASVTCVTATDGEFAPDEDRRRGFRLTRRAELAAALDVLGVVDRVWLDQPDGGCDTVDARVPVDAIGRIIVDRSPDTIITFGPDGFTGHPDHRAVSRWTLEAASRTGSRARILYPVATANIVAAGSDITSRFPIFEPGLPTVYDEDQITVALDLPDRWLDVKLLALKSHTSQTATLIGAIGEARFRSWVSGERFADAAAVATPLLASVR